MGRCLPPRHEYECLCAACECVSAKFFLPISQIRFSFVARRCETHPNFDTHTHTHTDSHTTKTSFERLSGHRPRRFGITKRLVHHSAVQCPGWRSCSVRTVRAACSSHTFSLRSHKIPKKRTVFLCDKRSYRNALLIKSILASAS